MIRLDGHGNSGTRAQNAIALTLFNTDAFSNQYLTQFSATGSRSLIVHLGCCRLSSLAGSRDILLKDQEADAITTRQHRYVLGIVALFIGESHPNGQDRSMDLDV